MILMHFYGCGIGGARVPDLMFLSIALNGIGNGYSRNGTLAFYVTGKMQQKALFNLTKCKFILFSYMQKSQSTFLSYIE